MLITVYATACGGGDWPFAVALKSLHHLLPDKVVRAMFGVVIWMWPPFLSFLSIFLEKKLPNKKIYIALLSSLGL